MGSLQHGSSRLSMFLFGSLALLPAASGVHAEQEFPPKSIRLIVPSPSGAVLDAVARPLALQLTEAFRQPVVVDNRPGNSGMVATEIAVRANPDGYTVLLVPSTYAASAKVAGIKPES